jgi:hypothetical protein
MNVMPRCGRPSLSLSLGFGSEYLRKWYTVEKVSDFVAQIEVGN